MPIIPQPSIAAFDIYTWESQAEQYPRRGPAGIEYVIGRFVSPGADQPMVVDGIRTLYVESVDPGVIGHQVWTLLYRNRRGHLVGILNYYPQTNAYEDRGNVNIWVKPECQKGGIATKLVTELRDRGWPTSWEQQRYTDAGYRFAHHALAEGLGR